MECRGRHSETLPLLQDIRVFPTKTVVLNTHVLFQTETSAIIRTLSLLGTFELCHKGGIRRNPQTHAFDSAIGVVHSTEETRNPQLISTKPHQACVYSW